MIFTSRLETRLVVVKGDAVVFTNNVFSFVFAELKRLLSESFCVKARDCLYHNGCLLNAAIKSDKMNMRKIYKFLIYKDY